MARKSKNINPPSRPIVWMLLTLAVLSILARGAAVLGGYINLDDPSFLTHNVSLTHGFSVEGLRFALTDTHTANWIPLTFISYMADTQLLGPGPLGPHLTNVLLNAGSVLVLFLALRAMTGSFWRSAAVASLLAVHPMHTESVAWVAERKDTLSLFLGLVSLWAYGGYARGVERWKWYGLSLLSFYGSLLSKSMFVTLPCVMLLVDYWPLCRLGWGESKEGRRGVVWLLVEKLPFVAGSVVISIVTVVVQQKAMAETDSLPWLVRWANVPPAYGWYLFRLLWPVNLSVFYIYEPLRPVWAVVAAPLVLAAISILVFFARRRRPWLLVGWLWFLGTMVPVIGLVQVGSASYACRYAYFPFIGLYMAIAWSLPDVSAAGRRQLAGAVAAAVLATLVTGSITEARQWQDTFTLFSHAELASPDSAMIRANLAEGFRQRDDLDSAFAEWLKAARLDMANPSVLAALAEIQMIHGNFGPAQALLRHVSAADRGEAPVLAAWGMILMHDGKFGEAIDDLRRAIAALPVEGMFHNRLAVALASAGRLNDALPEHDEAVRLKPTDSVFWRNYLLTLLNLRRPQEAGQTIAEAVRLHAHSSGAHDAAGVAMAQLGLVRQAVDEFQRALALDPGSPIATQHLREAMAAIQAGPGGGRP